MAQRYQEAIPHYPLSKEEAGPQFWSVAHHAAIAYPEKPGRRDPITFSNFLKTWIEAFPCPECVSNGKEYMRTNKPPFEDGSLEMQYYMCDFHNSVRQEQGKPPVDCEEMISHKKGACTTCSRPTDLYDVRSAINGIKRVSRRIIDELSVKENVPPPKLVFQPCPSIPDAAGCTRLPQGIIFINPKKFQLKSLIHEFKHYSLAYKGRSELEYSNEEEMDRMAYQIIDSEFKNDRGHYPTNPSEQESDFEDEEQPALNNSLKHQDLYDMGDDYDENQYIITANEGDDGEVNYWSNDDGWSDFKESATVFTKDQRNNFNLPIGKNVKWEYLGDDEEHERDYPDRDGGGVLGFFEKFYQPVSGILKVDSRDLNEAHTPEIIGNLAVLGAEYFLSPFGSVVASTLASAALMGYSAMAGGSMPGGDKKLLTELSAHLLWNGIRYLNPKLNGQAAAGAFSAGKAASKGDMSAFLATFTNASEGVMMPEEPQRQSRPIRSMPIEQEQQVSTGDNSFLADSMATNPIERAGEQLAESFLAGGVFPPSTGH